MPNCPQCYGNVESYERCYWWDEIPCTRAETKIAWVNGWWQVVTPHRTYLTTVMAPCGCEVMG